MHAWKLQAEVYMTPEEKPKPLRLSYRFPAPAVFPSLLAPIVSTHAHTHCGLTRATLPQLHLPVLLRSFTETMSSLSPGKPWQTKLSSAGLIYLHFGHKLLAQLLGTSEEDSMVGTLYDKVGT